jgi:hypothetical protein
VYELVEGEKTVAELHLEKVGGGSNMPAAMERGEIQVGLGGIPAVIFYVDKGSPFRILTPLNVDGDMLLVRPEFPADDWDSFVSAVKASEKPVRIGYKAPVAVAKLVFVGGAPGERSSLLRDVAAGRWRAPRQPQEGQQHRAHPRGGRRRRRRDQRALRQHRHAQEGREDREPARGTSRRTVGGRAIRAAASARPRRPSPTTAARWSGCSG